MARSVEALLARFLGLIPESWGPLRAVIAGVCAQLALAESTSDTFVDQTTIEEAEGIWLTLLARGYGVDRADGESDESLRLRLRNPERQVIKDAIGDAATALLEESDEALVIEHWAAPHMALDVDAACDVTDLFDQHNAFTVIVPEGYTVDVYAAILQEVDRVRAAGVRWWLVVEDGWA